MYFSTVFDDQYATGALAVFGRRRLSVGTAISRTAVCDAVAERLALRAEFDSRDDSYRWLLAWLMPHPHYAAGDRFGVLTTLERVGASSMNESPEQSDVIHARPDWTEHFQARQHVTRCGARVQGRCLRSKLERSSDFFWWVAQRRHSGSSSMRHGMCSLLSMRGTRPFITLMSAAVGRESVPIPQGQQAL